MMTQINVNNQIPPINSGERQINQSVRTSGNLD